MLTIYPATQSSSHGLVASSQSTTTANASSANEDPPLFDISLPFLSIAEFANSHCYLSSQQKREFSTQLIDFFTQLAYEDRACPIPEEQEKRFVQQHLPVLLETLDLPDEEKLRLVALLEKVSGLDSSQLDQKWHIEQITIQNDKTNEPFWGWRPRSASSQSLPSSRLYSLQGSGLKSSSHKAEESFRQFLPKIGSLKELEQQGAASRWFDRSQPFESLARFARRFAVLTPEEQKNLFGTIAGFFSKAAYKGNNYSLSEEAAAHLAVSHLPFLLDWYKNLPPNSLNGKENQKVEFNKHQLVASI